jgi:hypothetical protein
VGEPTASALLYVKLTNASSVFLLYIYRLLVRGLNHPPSVRQLPCGTTTQCLIMMSAQEVGLDGM